MLRATNLGRKFGGAWLFRKLEIDLEQGNCLCIVGNNGSGKSTLVKVLAGLLPASEGSVERPQRPKLGYAALDLALYAQLTPLEHIHLVKTLGGSDTHSRESLASVGLAGAENKPVGQFSTGMRARLKLLLAVLHEPDVLLLDEPSAALDESGEALVGRIVAEQKSRGAVVIATNHLPDRRHATHELVLGP